MGSRERGREGGKEGVKQKVYGSRIFCNQSCISTSTAVIISYISL